ncbi:hypothetical protein SDC9_120931 [bioreactor metagenome]|uniref:Uncharacterized protein n=1 Tax=bioreactor metagenome TaxID=1076179 RepID=A0A645CAI6_9ZZZZ
MFVSFFYMFDNGYNAMISSSSVNYNPIPILVFNTESGILKFASIPEYNLSIVAMFNAHETELK